MKRKRITFLIWLGFSVLHGATVLIVGIPAMWMLAGVLRALPIFVQETATVAMGVGVLALFLGAPWFGLFWSERFVEGYNRRIPDHYCVNCDYDLTGNVSGRCPECGTKMEQKARQGDSFQ